MFKADIVKNKPRRLDSESGMTFGFAACAIVFVLYTVVTANPAGLLLIAFAVIVVVIALGHLRLMFGRRRPNKVLGTFTIDGFNLLLSIAETVPITIDLRTVESLCIDFEGFTDMIYSEMVMTFPFIPAYMWGMSSVYAGSVSDGNRNKISWGSARTRQSYTFLIESDIHCKALKETLKVLYGVGVDVHEYDTKGSRRFLLDQYMDFRQIVELRAKYRADSKLKR